MKEYGNLIIPTKYPVLVNPRNAEWSGKFYRGIHLLGGLFRSIDRNIQMRYNHLLF